MEKTEGGSLQIQISMQDFTNEEQYGDQIIKKVKVNSEQGEQNTEQIKLLKQEEKLQEYQDSQLLKEQQQVQIGSDSPQQNVEQNDSQGFEDDLICKEELEDLNDSNEKNPNIEGNSSYYGMPTYMYLQEQQKKIEQMQQELTILKKQSKNQKDQKTNINSSNNINSKTKLRCGLCKYGKKDYIYGTQQAYRKHFKDKHSHDIYQSPERVTQDEDELILSQIEKDTNINNLNINMNNNSFSNINQSDPQIQILQQQQQQDSNNIDSSKQKSEEKNEENQTNFDNIISEIEITNNTSLNNLNQEQQTQQLQLLLENQENKLKQQQEIEKTIEISKESKQQQLQQQEFEQEREKNNIEEAQEEIQGEEILKEIKEQQSPPLHLEEQKDNNSNQSQANQQTDSKQQPLSLSSNQQQQLDKKGRPTTNLFQKQKEIPQGYVQISDLQKKDKIIRDIIGNNQIQKYLVEFTIALKGDSIYRNYMNFELVYQNTEWSPQIIFERQSIQFIFEAFLCKFGQNISEIQDKIENFQEVQNEFLEQMECFQQEITNGPLFLNYLEIIIFSYISHVCNLDSKQFYQNVVQCQDFNQQNVFFSKVCQEVEQNKIIEQLNILVENIQQNLPSLSD